MIRAAAFAAARIVRHQATAVRPAFCFHGQVPGVLPARERGTAVAQVLLPT